MSSRRWMALSAALVASVCAAHAAVAQSPAYFRVDNGRAIADDETLPEKLSPEYQVWKQPIATGHSTPTIVGDRIYLTGHDGQELQTICLDRLDGKQLWKEGRRVEQLEKTHREGSPAAATPACDERGVYAFFGSFGLVAYDRDGKPLWAKPLGPFRDEFGAGSSPILIDGKLILNEDHDLDSYLLAVRPESGETLWQTPRDGFTRSYATPVVWEIAGQKQIVIAGSLQLVGYDPANGKQLWARDGFARIVNTTPTIADGMMFVCTWSPGGDSDARVAMEPWETALQLWDKNTNGRLENAELPDGEVRSRFFRIDLNSDQALDESEWSKYARIFELAQNTLVALRPGTQATEPPQVAWEYRRGLPYVSSPLVYRDRVVLVKDGGIITILDAARGKLLGQGRAGGDGNYYASPVAGDGKIYLASGAGVVTVLAAGPKVEVISSYDFGERIAATPVIADGCLYIRTEKALYCFSDR